MKENSCETLKVKDVDKGASRSQIKDKSEDKIASSSSSKNSSDKDKCGDQRSKNKPDEASKAVFTGKEKTQGSSETGLKDKLSSGSKCEKQKRPSRFSPSTSGHSTFGNFIWEKV